MIVVIALISRHVETPGLSTNPENLSSRERLRCMIALVAALAVVSITSSLTWPILSESLRLAGYSEAEIGLNAAAQFAGIIVVASLAPRIIPRFGFFRCIVGGLTLAGLMLVLLPLFRDYHTWFVLRFIMGIGNSLLFTTGDTWVNQIVENRVRGRWMGIYSTVGMAGWSLGPILGANMDPESFAPFLVGFGTVALAALLLIPTRRIDIRLQHATGLTSQSAKLWVVFLIAPTVLLSSGVFGVVEGGMNSFAHLYTMDVLGQEYRAIGYAVIWVGAVSAIFWQYPIGWLADKMDRGWLLVGCVFTTTVTIALFPLLIEAGSAPWWTPKALALWACIAVWGGTMGATFTVGITLLGERFQGVELVTANAVFSLLFGIGGLLGPFLVGLAMGHFGPSGFPVSMLIVVSAYTVFAIYRQATRSMRSASGVH
jgi:MFS family permease